jgi:iron(III) transport system substrate-binding protein
MRKLFIPLIALLSLCTLSCTSDETVEQSGDKPGQKSGSLVVYSGRAEALVAPLFTQFTERTGIKVDVRYNTTGALATQALAEKQQTPADIFFFQETGYLSSLGKAGLVQALPDYLLNPVAKEFADNKRFWVATSARARVLAYNTTKVKPEDLPKSLAELPDSRWQGKLGWAPSNASLQAHVSALRHLWGEQETKQWLEKFIADKPTSYPKNAAQVLAVSRGEIDIAWTNHYYLFQLKKQQPDLPVANYSFTHPQDAGNILMLAGVGISTHTQQQANAEKLVAFLLSEDAQNYITNDGFEYPTRTGVATHPGIPPLSSLNLAPVQQTWLSEVEPTLKLLQEVGAL